MEYKIDFYTMANYVQQGALALMAVLFIIYLYCYFNKKTYFFYSNSIEWKMLKWIAIISLIFIAVTVHSTPNSIYVNVLLPISIGYFISFVFYTLTTVYDRNKRDKEVLSQLKTVAACKIISDGIKHELNSLPCKPEKAFGNFKNDCNHSCKWHIDNNCRYLYQLKEYIIFLQRKLDISLLIITRHDSEIASLLSQVLDDIQKLKFCLDNNCSIDNLVLNGIDDAHNLLYGNGTQLNKRILYADAKAIMEKYNIFYEECKEKYKYNNVSCFIANITISK